MVLKFGDLLGEGIGRLGGALVGQSDKGGSIGRTIGSWLPFKKGGRVLAKPAPMMKGGKVKKAKAPKAKKTKSKAKKAKK